MRTLYALLGVLTCAGCTHHPQTHSQRISIGTSDSNAIVVPILRLIAAPDEFAGKHVRVLGFLHLEFEGSALYPTAEHAEEFLMLNGLGVSLTRELSGAASNLTDRYVILEGVFRPRTETTFSGWAGSIDDVYLIEEWSLGKSWRLRQQKISPNL